MNIKNIRRNQVIASAILMSMVLASSGASAKSSGNELPETLQQPFVFASQSQSINKSSDSSAIVNDTFVMANKAPAHPKTIVHGQLTVAREMFVDSTGYTSEVAQTDDTPFITANGEHVYAGGVAANFLPFGTKIRIPDYYGDQVFTVNDRMNQRYDKRVDIWFAQKPVALKWGIRHNVRIQILAS